MTTILGLLKALASFAVAVLQRMAAVDNQRLSQLEQREVEEKRAEELADNAEAIDRDVRSTPSDRLGGRL